MPIRSMGKEAHVWQWRFGSWLKPANFLLFSRKSRYSGDRQWLRNVCAPHGSSETDETPIGQRMFVRNAQNDLATVIQKTLCMRRYRDQNAVGLTGTLDENNRGQSCQEAWITQI